MSSDTEVILLYCNAECFAQKYTFHSSNHQYDLHFTMILEDNVKNVFVFSSHFGWRCVVSLNTVCLALSSYVPFRKDAQSKASLNSQLVLLLPKDVNHT
jgi:hypothetical protein